MLLLLCCLLLQKAMKRPRIYSQGQLVEVDEGDGVWQAAVSTGQAVNGTLHVLKGASLQECSRYFWCLYHLVLDNHNALQPSSGARADLKRL